MSQFLDKQENECEEIEEIEVEKKLCPTCVPNPFAPTIDWLTQEEPYFDEKTCEYIIRAIGHKVQDAFINGIYISTEGPDLVDISGLAGGGFVDNTIRTRKTFDSLRQYASYFKDKFTRDLLRHYNKDVTEENLKLSVIPEQGIIVNSNSLINFKVSIPAQVFNNIPGAPTPEQLEEDKPDAEANAGLPSTVTINDEDFTFGLNLFTTKMGITSYELRYCYYRNVNKGVVTYDIEDQVRFFEPKHIKNSLTEFKEALDRLLSQNGMGFYSLAAAFFPIYDVVTKVEIELDNSNEDKPMAIKKVFATSGMCPRKELLKGIDVFKEKGYIPQALFFVNKFDNVFSDITGQQPKEWLEFFEEYTYPPIKASISTSEQVEIEESAAACALDLDIGKLAEGLLENFLVDFWDAFSHQFNIDSCKDDAEAREPALKQSLNPNEQEQRELLYREELDKIRKERAREAPEFPEIDDSETHQEGANLLADQTQTYRKQVEDFENDLKEEAMKRAEERLGKMDKEQFKHPFFKHFKNSMKKRMEDDQSIISIFYKINQEDIPSSQKTQKFINSIGMCGVTKGFRDALACLTKQVDFGTLIKSTVKTFLQNLGINNLNEALASLLVGLPPEKQIEVTMKIEQQFGKIKPPWESGNTTDLDKQQAKKEQAQLTALAAHPDKDISNVPQAGESEFTRGVQQGVQASYDAIITAYLEAILGASTPDELIAKYKKKIPALAFILDRIDRAKCPTEPEKDIKNKKIKKFNFDICDPTIPPINFKIPKFTFKPNLFLNIKDNAIKALREAIMKAIAALVHKLIKILEEKLCDFLSALGKAGFNLLTGEPVDFLNILRDAFCPDASDDEVRDLGNNLLNKIGVKDSDVQDAFDCFAGAILGTMTQKEMLDLITKVDKDPQALRLFMETIKVGCPRMFDLVNTPSRASNFLNSIGNLIPSDVRSRLITTPVVEDELPFFNSICLTSAELDVWNNYRRSQLENNGLSPEDAAEQLDIFNQRAQDALEDALNAINNGPGTELDDLLRDLLDALPEIEGCELKDGESNAGNKLFREPEELVKVQDEISNRIFDNIIDVNSKDLFKKPVFGSLIEKILSDTEGNHKGFHTFLDGFFFTQFMYHDYDGAYDVKIEKANFLEKFFDFSGGDKGSGFYPSTVGNSLRNQIIEPAEYTSTNLLLPRTFQRRTNMNIDYDYEISPAREAPSYAKQFLRNVKVTENSTQDFKGSVGFISSDLTNFTENLDYKIFSQCSRIGLSLVSTQKIDAEDLLADLPDTDNIEIRNTVFDKFVQNCLTDLQYSPDFSSTSNYENFISLIFDETISSVMNKSDCFNFGFLQETLTEDDFRYVDPEPGSEEYTYEESDQVLGRSYTNSDRVFFLSPEEYGGTYEVPPVYIVPKKMTGWLGLSQTLFPDEEECEVKSENIFGGSDIKKFINNRRNSMVSDDKLKQLNDKCYFDKPFGKILSRNASSSIEGVIKISLRSKIVKEFIKSLPVLSCLKMTDQNYDRSVTELILQKITSELKIVDPFGPRDIEKENYYLLFLEQCYQSYEKRFIEKLPKITDPDTGLETDEYDFTTLGKDVEDAYKKISLFRENFSYENANTESDIELTLLKGQILDHTILEREDFGALAGSYQRLGNKLLTSSDTYTYKKPLFQGDRVTNLFSVLLAIKLCEKEALVILREMIFKEFEEITEKFHKTYDPIVTDINKFILSNETNIFLDNKIQEYGTHLYNQKRDVGSVTSLGTPEDVVDVATLSPFPEGTAEKMKIEKYIRIKEKINHDLPLEVTEILDSRDHNLRGVVSLENLQQFFNDNIEVLGEYYITDLFGDAELTPIGEPIGDLEQETEITGDIGLSAGLRIVLNLPEKVFTPDQITAQDLELSKTEKCYYCIHENMDASLSFSIPITSAEVFLMDTKIKDLDLLEQYDTHCLLEKIIKTKKYNDLFRKITPIQAATSLALNYCDTFFISSIGQDDGWSATKMIKDDSKEVSDGAMVCRRYFASFYNSNRYGHSEFLGLPKIEFPDFFKLLFGGFEFPEVNLKFILPFEFQFDHKIIRTNPFDKNGEKCSDK